MTLFSVPCLELALDEPRLLAPLGDDLHPELQVHGVAHQRFDVVPGPHPNLLERLASPADQELPLGGLST